MIIYQRCRGIFQAVNDVDFVKKPAESEVRSEESHVEFGV